MNFFLKFAINVYSYLKIEQMTASGSVQLRLTFFSTRLFFLFSCALKVFKAGGFLFYLMEPLIGLMAWTGTLCVFKYNITTTFPKKNHKGSMTNFAGKSPGLGSQWIDGPKKFHRDSINGLLMFTCHFFCDHVVSMDGRTLIFTGS